MAKTFRVKQIVAAIFLCLLAAFANAPTVMAAQSSSPNYSVDEVNFGSGGVLNACSDSYCAKQSAGELTVGNTKSGSYQAQAGFNTDRQPLLEVSVDGGPIDLGILDAATTKFGSTTFSVRTYPAYGYSVFLDGSAPTNNSSGYTLASMASADISRPGTEQFGINLRQNATPAVGADVQQLPDDTFSFGVPATGYGTADSFKYVPGDTIALSPKSSGQTVFTLSAIENVSTNTPAGVYSAHLSVIVVPTF